MGLTQVLDSPHAKRLSVLTMLVEAGIALLRGNKKVAALLVGAAAIAYRWSGVGFAVEILIRLYQRRR
jgi:hypothetical protein